MHGGYVGHSTVRKAPVRQETKRAQCTNNAAYRMFECDVSILNNRQNRRSSSI